MASAPHGWLDRKRTDRTVLHDSANSDSAILDNDGGACEWNAMASDQRTTDQILATLAMVGLRVEQRLDDQTNSRVFRARRITNGAQLAIKVLVHPRGVTSAVQRFRQESRLLTTLRHVGLVHAQGRGSLRGIHYLVLDLAQGHNLRQVVENEGPLAVNRAATVAYQAADVLDYLHQQGVIHRDIKPSNFVLGDDGRLKLLDLGLARVESAGASVTHHFGDRLLGTPDFMAPEQARDCHYVDARADIYSLGCTLYYLLAGHPPLAGRNLVDSLLKHQRVRPPLVSTARPEVPTPLANLCDRMLAKDPAARIETAGEVAAALAPWTTART